MLRKFFVLTIASVILGGAAINGFFPHRAEAGILDDIKNFFKGISAPAATSTEDQGSRIKDKEQKEEQKPVTLYKPAIDYEEAVTSAVEKASPSVVSIAVSKDVPVIERCRYNPWGDLPPEFQDFFGGGFQYETNCQRGTEKREVGGGSGFIISEDGLIVTNKHVVLDESAEYTVFTNDGKKHEAKVLARDPILDLAVIKIETRGLVPARLGDSDAVKLGQTAIAIGNALGEFRNTVSLGVVSGLARDITASGGGFSERIEGLIQTDAAINSGNSGGPLLNLKGEVIGVNTAMVSGAQNIGFAIPINQAKRDIQSVKTTGTIKTPYVGIRYVPITPELAKKQSMPVEYGIVLRGSEEGPAVYPDTPASRAGLRAEDIILEVNGEKVEKKSFATIIQKYDVGETIALKVRRGNQVLEIKIRLGERPADL